MTNSELEQFRITFATGKRGPVVDAGEKLIAQVQKLQRRREANKGPTLSEVMELAEKRAWPAGMAEEFFDHYEMIGWVYGKCHHPIRKIPNAMSTWERNEKKRNGTNGHEKPAGIGSRYGVG